MNKYHTLIALALASVIFAGFIAFKYTQLPSLEIEQTDIPQTSTSINLESTEHLLSADLQDTLLTLQQSFNNLHSKHQELVTANAELQQRIELLNQTNSQPEQGSPINNRPFDSASWQQNQQEITEQNEHKFNQHFDDIWVENSYEDADQGWAMQLETSLSEIQQHFENSDLATPVIVDQSCSANSCTLELAHHNTSVEERNQFFNELTFEGASQVMVKHVSEGDVDRTQVIFLR